MFKTKMRIKQRGSTMNITDIRVRNVHIDGKLKAYVTVTFDDKFVIHNVKVIEGENGVFIAMPSRKTKKGEYKDVAHPINTEFRGYLQQLIISEYDKTKGQITHYDDDDD